MRVLFLESSQIWSNTLPLGFRDIGHQVMISGPLTEQNFPRIIDQFGPDLVFSIGWGPEQTKSKQILIGKHVKEAGVPLVYWATEDPHFTQKFTLPLIKTMEPDFIFTVCPSTAEYYNKNGIKAARLDFAYHPGVHHPTGCHRLYRCTLAVVANAYPHVLASYPGHYRNISLQTLIRPLLEEKIRIDFWGREWGKMKPFLGRDIPREWIHGHLPYKETCKVYSSADIIIGLQNYPALVTQRTYEILGSCGLLLTSDTPGIRKQFKPGRDILVSSSPEDTVRQVLYYLKHPGMRQQIRKNGKKSVIKHSYNNRAEYIISVLLEQRILHAETF